MKSVARALLLGAALMVLQACEDKLSNAGTSTLAGSGGTFSLATVESITPDFTRSFTLTGNASTGSTLTATFSEQNLPSTSFNGNPAIPRVQTLAITNAQTNGFTNTQQTLYLGAGFQILGFVDNLTGVRCVPLNPLATIPATVAIGDNGVLGTLSCSDGTQRQFAWRVDGTSLGLGIQVLVTTVLDAAGSQLATEELGQVVDSAGAIHGVTFFRRDLTTGVTVTLQSPVI